MVNDFMVCVDRIIASACLQSVNQLETNSGFHQINDDKNIQKIKPETMNTVSSSSCLLQKELKECRICQEEDDDNSLESPCACNGTLKVFTPNYSHPPKPAPDVMAVDISQAWGPHFGFREHHLLALTAAERQLLESEYDDYAVANAGNVTYLRSIAIIVEVSLLQIAGFLLPCYALVRSWYILYTRRRRQG
ncbi:putative E3 ubiquitin ligase SUD1 [Bienertia sinuspersici]